MVTFSISNSPFISPTLKAIELGAPFEFASQFTSKWQIKTLEFLLPYARPNFPIELICKISLKINNYIHYKALSLGTPLEQILNFTLDSQIEALIFLVETAKINIPIEVAVEISLAITTDLHNQALQSGVPVHYVKEFNNKFQLQAYNHLADNNTRSLPIDKIVKLSLKINSDIQLEALMLNVPAESAPKFIHKSQIAVFLYFQQHREPWKPIDEIIKIALDFTTDLQYQALIYSSEIKFAKDFTNIHQLQALKLGVEARYALKFNEEFQVEALTVLMKKFNLTKANDQVTNLALYFENEDQLDAYEAGVPLYTSLQFKAHNVMALEYMMKTASISIPTEQIIEDSLNIKSFEQARALQVGVPLKDTELFTILTQIYAFTYLTKNEPSPILQDIINKALQITNAGSLLAIKSDIEFSTALNFTTECQVKAHTKLNQYLIEEAKNSWEFWQWLFPQHTDPIAVALKFKSESQCKLLENSHNSADIVRYSELSISGETHATNEAN